MNPYRHIQKLRSIAESVTVAGIATVDDLESVASCGVDVAGMLAYERGVTREEILEAADRGEISSHDYDLGFELDSHDLWADISEWLARRGHFIDEDGQYVYEGPDGGPDALEIDEY